MHDLNEGAVLVKRKSVQVHVTLHLIHCACTRKGDSRENAKSAGFSPGGKESIMRDST